MTCNHIEEAKKLLIKARQIANEDVEIAGIGFGASVRAFIPLVNMLDTDTLRNQVDQYREWTIEIWDLVEKARVLLDSCNCSEAERSQKERLQVEVDYLKQEIGSFKEKENNLQKDLIYLRKDKDSFENKSNSLDKTVNSLKEKANLLENSLNKNERDLKEEQKQIKNLKKIEDNLRKEIEKKEQSISSLTNESEEYKERTNSLRALREYLGSIRLSLSEQLEKSEGDKRKLQNDLSQFQRTLLVFGETGAGKSNLIGNLIFGNSPRAAEDFKASSGSVSETKETKVGEFVAENGTKYRVIDIIGFGDTNLSEEETSRKIKEATFEGDYNLNQVFFAFNGRFSDGSMRAFDLLKKIFGEEIIGHTTVVRTHFPDFRDDDLCEEDRESLLDPNKSNEKIISIIESSNGIIHIDNPRIEENKKEKEGKKLSKKEKELIEKEKELEKEVNLKKRELSREKLLKHLLFNCSNNYQSRSFEDGTEQKEERSYLLIGKKGVGKSTLINNILDSNGEFKEISREAGKNDCYQISVFEDKEGNKHRIVEIVGVDDQKFSSQEAIYDLAEAFGEEFENGVNQIFFVTDGTLQEQEIGLFGIITGLFGGNEEILKYTTFVQTKFSKIEDEEACQRSYLDSIERNGIISVKLIEAVGKGKFIYVDNESNESGLSARAMSRSRLTNVLTSSRTTYKPRFLGSLVKGIKDILTGGGSKQNQSTQTAINSLIKQNPALGTIAQAAQVGSQIGGGSLPVVGAPAGGLIGLGTAIVGQVVNSVGSAASSVIGLSTLRAENNRLKTQLVNAQKERDARPNTSLTLKQIQDFQARPTKDALNAVEKQRDARPNITPQQWATAQNDLTTVQGERDTARRNLATEETAHAATQQRLQTLQGKLTSGPAPSPQAQILVPPKGGPNM